MMLIQIIVRISAGQHVRAGGDRELRQNVLDPFPEVRTVVIHLRIFERIFKIHPPLLSPRLTLKDGY
jgi:hypothetical protein